MPATISIAASMSLAFRSGILISAISRADPRSACRPLDLRVWRRRSCAELLSLDDTARAKVLHTGERRTCPQCTVISTRIMVPGLVLRLGVERLAELR